MVVGINAFKGERLTQARTLRQLTSITALAELSSMSKEAISRYESGKGKPTEESLNRLASTLNLPKEFFLKETPNLGTYPMMFRSMATSLKAERGRARELLNLGLEAGMYFSSVLELPEVRIPRLNARAEIRGLTNAMIEEAAIQTRRTLGFPSGPLPNLVTLAERCGVMVTRTRLADRELDGVSKWNESLPTVLINNTKSAARSRFDLAHEIGHLVLHSYMPEELAEASTLHKLLENQAHRFASALLLPAEEFTADVWLISIDEFLLLKPKWQVSAQAMIRRARDLDLVDDFNYIRMMKQVSARKWRTGEPLEDVVPEEIPTLLESCLRVIAEDPNSGLELMRRALPFSSVLEDLSGYQLDQGENNKIVRLSDFRRFSS